MHVHVLIILVIRITIHDISISRSVIDDMFLKDVSVCVSLIKFLVFATNLVSILLSKLFQSLLSFQWFDYNDPHIGQE